MNDIIKLNLTDQQRTDLKSEFDKLETIDEKLEFWTDKLGIDFCYFDQCEMYDIQDFWIIANNENEFEYINTRNIRKYKERTQPFQGRNRFQDFEERKQAFLNKIENVPNKNLFINEEIRQLDTLISQKELENNSNNLFKSRFFISTYRKYMESGFAPIWNNTINEVGNLIESEKGLIIAKYKQFLEDYQSPKKPEPKTQYAFSHDQQIFILDYLIFYTKLDNKKKAKLYAPIINRDIETTRQRFSSLEKRKTVINLEPVLSYFTDLGFKEQIELVKKDIDRLKRKR